MDKRRRLPFAVPPELYFQTPGGFHPVDYTRCVAATVDCDYCSAKRGQFCHTTWTKLKPVPRWTNSSHCSRVRAFGRWRKYHKLQYQNMRQVVFEQYKKAYQIHTLSTPCMEMPMTIDQGFIEQMLNTFCINCPAKAGENCVSVFTQLFKPPVLVFHRSRAAMVWLNRVIADNSKPGLMSQTLRALIGTPPESIAIDYERLEIRTLAALAELQQEFERKCPPSGGTTFMSYDNESVIIVRDLV